MKISYCLAMPKYTRTNSFSLPNLLAFQWQGPHVWGLKMWQIRTPLIVQCLAHIWPLLKTKRKKDPFYTTKKMERTHQKKWYRPQHFSHLHRKLVKTDYTTRGLRTKFGRFCLHNTNSRQDISILIRNYSTVHAISEIITQAGLTMKKLRHTSFFLGKKGVYFQPQTPKNFGPVPAGCLWSIFSRLFGFLVVYLSSFPGQCQIEK